MKLQNPSAILAAGPAQLLDQSLDDYADFFERAGNELAEPHLEAVDYALRHKIVRLLVRRAPREEHEALYDGLRTLVPVEQEDAWRDWCLRWRALADVLDARLGSLAAQEPEKARRLLHAPEILELVAAEPGLSQVEVGERLELKPANLSRILGVLEAHDLIERRNVGREKRVYLGFAAEDDFSTGSARSYPRQEAAAVFSEVAEGAGGYGASELEEMDRGMSFLFSSSGSPPAFRRRAGM
ncbi:MAG: helix-turn-helix domain-containing protein [Acidobacteriota bacterium]|nr:helix-turn-helix domain-containing protein [Acidobacteriota bacterium]